MAMLAQKDMVGDQKMLEATGRMPEEWFALLDAEGATAWTHTRIAAWLRTVHGSPPWWDPGHHRPLRAGSRDARARAEGRRHLHCDRDQDGGRRRQGGAGGRGGGRRQGAARTQHP